jgi:hypothetical protein
MGRKFLRGAGDSQTMDFHDALQAISGRARMTASLV